MDNITNNAFYIHEPFFFHYNKALSSNMPTAHFHEKYEIYYLISGQRRYFIEDEIYDIYPGDMILIPEMKLHKVWSTPGVSTAEYHERFLITPNRKDIPDIFLSCFDTHFYHLPPEANETILNCFHSIQKNIKNHDACTPYYNQANLIQILCTLARLPISKKHTQQFSKNELIMQDAALYIKNNCSQPLTLNKVAQKYFFSKEYFSTIFKQTIGFGFNEYLTQMRISKAVDLLNTTSLPITEISNICGFNDSNYFAAVFKKIMGGTPRQFRPSKTIKTV